MRRGEIWWVDLDERCPVVLLSEPDATGLRALRVVRPATAAERRGFVLLSGAEVGDPETVSRIVASAPAGIRAVGVELHLEPGDGLPGPWAIRLALPRDGHTFCTWLTTLTPGDLLERAGELRLATLVQLGHALHLAGVQ